MTEPAGQQVIAALLARRHIILSGPIGIGKTQLAQALAASMTGDYHRQTQNRALWSDAHTQHSFGDDVISIHNMSSLEIDLYFKGSLPWLTGDAREFPLRLIGTYDSEMPPELDPDVLRVAALVHFGKISVENPV